MSEKRKKGIHEGPHKYFQTQFKQSGTLIFRCGLANCPHFVYEPLILGRISICWRCGNEFVLTKRSLRSKKLHCEECSRGRYNKPKEKKIFDTMFDDIFNDTLNILSDLNRITPNKEGE